jgi:hypothetical protein
MVIPAAGHAKLSASAVPVTEGLQQRVDLAAEVGFDVDAVPFQRPAERFGDRRAEEDIHLQFDDAMREDFGGERAQQKLPAIEFTSALLPDDEQSRRGVEHGRDPILPDGDRHSHGARYGTWRASKVRVRVDTADSLRQWA